MIFRPIHAGLLLLAVSIPACSARAPQPSLTATPVVGNLQTATPIATRAVRPSPVPLLRTPTVAPAPLTFTEEFDQSPAYWTFVGVDNGQSFAGPTTRDGFLVFDLTAPDQWAYAFYLGHDYKDVAVETELQNRTVDDGAGGLVCRYDEQKGWYEFNVYADQTYQLLYGQWLAPGVARYTPLYQAQSEKISSESNQLGLQCVGDVLTPSINGVLMRRWQDQKFGLKSGKIGVSAASFQEVPATLAFDRVKVSVP